MRRQVSDTSRYQHLSGYRYRTLKRLPWCIQSLSLREGIFSLYFTRQVTGFSLWRLCPSLFQLLATG